METESLKELTAFRKDLHQHPELSGSEYETQARIIMFLRKLGYQDIVKLANTGVMVVLENDSDGPTILLRADIDALPIEEVNDFTHKSSKEGISHKCGHDGHTTILLAVAQLLARQHDIGGRIVLLFQPAEEIGQGAKAVLGDDKFRVKPDYVFALHNIPGSPLHEIILKRGVFTAAVTSVIIRLKGKTAHAAEPEKGTNPAAALQKIIALMASLEQPDPSTEDFFLATPVFIHMGEKSYGVSAGEGEAHFTLRAWKNNVLNEMKKKAIKKVETIAKDQQLGLSIDWTEEFSGVENDSGATDMVADSARSLGLSVQKKETPFKWGEDFGLFTSQFRGAMFGIGAGEHHPALHNPDYDFPDELIETGSKLFMRILKGALHVQHIDH